MRPAYVRLLHCCALCLAAAGGLPPGAFSQAGSAVASSQPTVATDTYHLHGIVVDSHTGKPIARALVQGYGDRLATLTDHDGRFALELRLTAPTGETPQMIRQMQAMGTMFLGLTARKPGYVARQPFMTTTVPLSALDQDFLLKLTPDAVIEGRVAATGDDHPESVQISLLKRIAQDGYARWGQVAGTATNSHGEYRFAGLQPGEYKLATAEWADGPGEPSGVEKPVLRYPPVFYPAGSAAASGPEISPTPGEVVPVNLNLHPETFYPVRIPVSLPDGNNGMQVRVQRVGWAAVPAAGFYLRYRARDKVVEGVLPSGAYEVFLQAGVASNAATTATVALTVQGGPVETAPVTFLPSVSIPVIVHQDYTHADATGGLGFSSTGRSGPVSGRVLTEMNGPLNNGVPVQIVLTPAEGVGASVALTQGRPNGDTPVIEHVPPGTYRMASYLIGHQGYIASATSGGTDLLRDPLVVSPSGGVAPIEITLRDDVGTVTGTIDMAGLDIANGLGLQIAAVPAQPSTRMLQQGGVNNEGKFIIRNLAPGSYRVFASRQPVGMLEYRSEEFMKRNGSKGALVTVEADGSATVTLTAVLDEEP